LSLINFLYSTKHKSYFCSLCFLKINAGQFCTVLSMSYSCLSMKKFLGKDIYLNFRAGHFLSNKSARVCEYFYLFVSLERLSSLVSPRKTGNTRVIVGFTDWLQRTQFRTKIYDWNVWNRSIFILNLDVLEWSSKFSKVRETLWKCNFSTRFTVKCFLMNKY